MNHSTNSADHDLGSLAEDARALLAATTEVAGEKIADARKRLASALESGRKIAAQVKDKAAEGVKATDSAVREHPYAAIGIALGVGSIIGFLLANTLSRSRH